MRPLIAGNWKMHGLAMQLAQIEMIASSVQALAPPADILICPPATLLARAAQLAAGRIAIGGQNCHSEISGAHTGDISAEMLRDAGASAVIVGHSEQRQQHGDTNEMVAAKTRAALRAGLSVIICVGETQLQRKNGQALATCGEQIQGSVPRHVIPASIAIGYEPLWAIGSGQMPGADQIQTMHAHIRQCLVAHLGETASEVRVLYGGSVKPSNAKKILALTEVDGALVGGASLEATDFEAIVRTLMVEQ